MRDIIYAHELQLVDMGGEHNEEAVQQEDLCYHTMSLQHASGTMIQECHYSHYIMSIDSITLEITIAMRKNQHNK